MRHQIIIIVAMSLVFAGCDQKERSSQNEGAQVGEAKVPAEPKPTEPTEVAEPTETNQARPERKKLVRGQPLPTLVRAALRQRMRDHGDDMESLLWAALMLDYESTESIADRMALAPSFSRPGPGSEGTLNKHMPKEFFTLQSELEESITALRKAANLKNDADVAQHYGVVASTCIRCHSLYLRIPTTP